MLRLWLRGEGLRAIAQLVAPDRKTIRRYVAAAEAAGLVRDGGEEQLTDALIGAVVESVRPVRPYGHGEAWGRCLAERDRIKGWWDAGVPVVKISDLLARRGVVVPERTLHRFWPRSSATAGRERRCRWSTATRAVSCRSTSVGSATSSIPMAAGGCCGR